VTASRQSRSMASSTSRPLQLVHLASCKAAFSICPVLMLPVKFVTGPRGIVWTCISWQQAKHETDENKSRREWDD